MTAYRVLRLHDDGDRWETVEASVYARSADDAIRATLGGEDDPERANGTYVAVPARSWKPQRVSVQTQTRLVLGDDT